MKYVSGIVLAAVAAAGLPMAAQAQEVTRVPGGGTLTKVDNALALPDYTALKEDYDRYYGISTELIGDKLKEVLVARFIRKGMGPPGGAPDTKPFNALPGVHTVYKGAWIPQIIDGGCNVVTLWFDTKTGAPMKQPSGNVVVCNRPDPPAEPVATPVAAEPAAPAQAEPEAQPAAATEPAAPAQAESPAQAEPSAQPSAQ